MDSTSTLQDIVFYTNVSQQVPILCAINGSVCNCRSMHGYYLEQEGKDFIEGLGTQHAPNTYAL